MIRSPTFLLLAWLLLACALPADAQPVDFSALVRYGEAWTKLKAAILTDAGKELGIDEHVIEWIKPRLDDTLPLPLEGPKRKR
jgi:hypothetical protein